jgi:hypothetical protein
VSDAASSATPEQPARTELQRAAYGVLALLDGNPDGKFNELGLEAFRRELEPLRRAAQAGKSKAKKAEEYNGYDVKRLDEVSIRRRPAIVQRLGLDESTVVAIGGVPNAGKTALAVDLGLHIGARCERWFDLKISGGPVLYCAAEAPGSVRIRATAALRRKFPDRRPSFYITAAAPGLGGEQSSDFDAFRLIATVQCVASLEGEPVKVVFVDTLASCLGDGDENGDGVLRLVNAAKFIASKTGASVVLVHHPTKGDGKALRGHSSLTAACDAILAIESDELTGVRTMTLVKARDSATGLQLRYELEAVALDEPDSFGDAVTTIIIKASSVPAARKRPGGRAQEQLLAELERRYRSGEHHWNRATICKAGRELGMHRNSPAAALEGLIRAGFVAGSEASLALTYPPECT